MLDLPSWLTRHPESAGASGSAGSRAGWWRRRWWERWCTAAMIDQIRTILTEIGEDPSRDGLQNTPRRVDEALRFLTSGYRMNADEVLNGALFDVAYDEMVIVRDIELFSLCEHHLLPFFGKCHVGYLPDGRVIGLSKIPRLVDMYARRLQVQERLTTQIAETINQKIHPKG